MPTNTYEQGYAGSSNGQHLPSDGEEAARQWITDVRQGKIAPPPICKWIGALKAALHVYQTAGLDAFNATLESYAQNVKLYAGLASVLRPRQKKKTESHARGDQDGDELTIPPLPESAHLPPEASVGACPWLDAYVKYAHIASPECCDAFIEATGLWILATVAARRIALEWDGDNTDYTALYIALIDHTSIAKSHIAKIAKKVLRQAGLGFLIGADGTTPQRLLSVMSGLLDRKYADMDEDDQREERNRLAFAAQIGWYYDEFGQQLTDITTKGNMMAPFRSLLRTLFDPDEKIRQDTNTRGSERVKKPYLALFGSMTFSDLQPFARQASAFWRDGFLARFALVTGPENTTPTISTFKRRGTSDLPDVGVPYSDVLKPLIFWHKRLGVPQVEIKDKLDKKTGKPTGDYLPVVEPLPETPCSISDEAWEAWNHYRIALVTYAYDKKSPEDFRGTYKRLPTMTIRIAALLASLENDGHMELCHYARAQELTESWRVNFHQVYASMLRGNGRLSRDAQLHEFILNTLQRGEAKDKAWLTPSQIWRANPDRLKGIGVDRVQVKNACYDLYQAQTLLMKNTAQAKFYALAPETDEEFPLQGNTQEQAREEVNW